MVCVALGFFGDLVGLLCWLLGIRFCFLVDRGFGCVLVMDWWCYVIACFLDS